VPDETPAPAAPTWTGHPAEGLALVRLLSPNDPNSQVFVIEADGSARQVTGLSGSLGASNPTWAPDGNRLAFSGAKRGEGLSGMVAVVNADGTDERQISVGSFPRWSPDGSMIVVQEVDDVGDEPHSSWLADPETGEITDLGLFQDGRWLGNDRLTLNMNAFAADGAVTSSLYLMDLATRETTFVADWTRAYPSPDSTQMLLVEQEDGNPATTWLADADGQAIRQLADGGDPVWSPDGTRVAVLYDFDQDANPVYRVVDLDGNELQSDIIGAYPTWSPDGTRLALEVYRPDMPVIQVVDVASGEVVWEEPGRQPAWRP
jgi:Tol biopolymer transport system component